MSKSWEGGSTRAWRKLRLKILDRDRWVCQVKITEVCTGKATVVHHTLGKTVTGDDPRYLVAACYECNEQVGDPSRVDPLPKGHTQW